MIQEGSVQWSRADLDTLKDELLSFPFVKYWNSLHVAQGQVFVYLCISILKSNKDDHTNIKWLTLNTLQETSLFLSKHNGSVKQIHMISIEIYVLKMKI